MSKMNLFPTAVARRTYADIELGSGLAANGSEQKVNGAEMREVSPSHT